MALFNHFTYGEGTVMVRRVTDRPDRSDGSERVYEVHYTEPDGTQEVDAYESPQMAADWADWCRADGCTDVEVLTVIEP
jgi:hypothetical protein